MARLRLMHITEQTANCNIIKYSEFKRYQAICRVCSFESELVRKPDARKLANTHDRECEIGNTLRRDNNVL